MSNNLKIAWIDNGIVIDHIKNESTEKIFKAMDITNKKGMISFAFNLKSKTMNSKGIIKIEDKELSDNEIDIISLFSPGSTINYIENGQIVKKHICKIPNKIDNLLVCKTTKCITNNEKNMSSSFLLKEKNNNVEAFCVYCERVFNIDELETKND